MPRSASNSAAPLWLRERHDTTAGPSSHLASPRSRARIADQDCCKSGEIAPAAGGMLRALADGVLPIGAGDLHRADLLVLEIAQSKSSGPGQEQIEHRPA